jgi:membrane protein DedA with SNARE-associated domain
VLSTPGRRAGAAGAAFGTRLLFDWITSIVSAYGYPGIALLMLGENIFPPIPSELIMPLAGASRRRAS